MSKYIIELPDNVSIKDGCITMTGNVGWAVIEKSVHNAVEVVGVDMKNIIGRYTNGDTMMATKGRFKLFAMKVEEDK